jgi:hypothetical protein
MKDDKTIYDYNNTNHDDKEDTPSNHFNNRPFTDNVEPTLLRRNMVQGTLTPAATSF